MSTKPQKIIGMKASVFQELVSKGDINVRTARLIPSVIRAGDEIALTSIFLSAIRMVKEFKEDIFTDIKVKKNGSHYFFTEVVFFGDKKNRPDGLILHVVSGEIRDAVIIEVKNKNNELVEEQMVRYIELSRTLGITKILTISNQFVPNPSQTPLRIKPPKGITLYHFSWSYILTLAHVLLYQNDHNISDDDQISIMREVVLFLESKDSGIYGFTSMKSGWRETVRLFVDQATPQKNDINVQNAILSWQQEVKDMALILSRKLGLIVQTASKQDLQARYENDFKLLSTKKMLISKLKIENIVSPIEVVAHFDTRSIDMNVQLEAPEKGIKGQIGWIKRQIEDCAKKEEVIFNSIKEEIRITALLKFRNEYPPFMLSDSDTAIEQLKEKEITGFIVSYKHLLAGKFDSPKNFVTIVETMLINFYSAIVQYLENPKRKIPQIQPLPSESEEILPVAE